MRLVLECHSQVQCCDESMAYRILAGTAPPPRQDCLLGLKVPCITEQFQDAVLSNGFSLPDVPNTYKGQKPIFMVRDVRDALVSMRRLQIGGKSWLENYAIPAIESKRRSRAFRERYVSALDLLKRNRSSLLAHGAFYWRYKVDPLERYRECGYPVLMVRYEDLAQEPAAQLLRVCHFLQIPWEDRLLQHPKFAHGELDEHGRAMGETDPTRMIDTQSVGQWANQFSPEELRMILEFAGPMQSTLYPQSQLSVQASNRTPTQEHSVMADGKY